MRNLAATRLAQLITPHARRHALSRRELLKAGAATTALMTASAAFAPLQAAAGAPGPGTPTPVAGDPAFGGLHINGVGIGIEPSAITDFNGAVGAAVVDGTGVGTRDRRPCAPGDLRVRLTRRLSRGRRPLHCGDASDR